MRIIRTGRAKSRIRDVSVQTTEHEGDCNALLETVDLTCSRGDRLLFVGLAMRIGAGEVVQISGPNGSGKTTLLRILCGLQPATDGHIRWRGVPVPPGDPDLRAEIQYIGHAGGVKLDLTPRENLDVAIALGAGPTGMTPDTALARLGIGEAQNAPLRTLSAGQRQRVALARLLACRCTLWILDEPFTALDRSGVAVVDSMLRTHAEAGGAAVITSHHPVALDEVAPRLVHLDQVS